MNIPIAIAPTQSEPLAAGQSRELGQSHLLSVEHRHRSCRCHCLLLWELTTVCAVGLQRLLGEHDDVQLSALGMAVSTMVSIVEILKKDGLAVETRKHFRADAGCRSVDERSVCSWHTVIGATSNRLPAAQWHKCGTSSGSTGCLCVQVCCEAAF